MNNKILLEVKNLSMQFGGLKAVDNVSFNIYDKEIVALIGPNGAGKTTVFNCITQFYKDDDGEILFTNRQDETLNLNNIHVTKVINQGLVRTFQNVELVKDLSILDNVLIGAHNQFTTGVFQHILKTPKAKKEEKLLKEEAIKVLDFLNIGHLKDMYAFGQPYGVLKKIEIARTLMCNPKLIILDEPAAGLNDAETEELAKIIYQIREKYDCSILLVEHDMSFVMTLSDRIIAINFGKFLAEGTPHEIQNNKLVKEAYLGGDDSE